MHILRKISYSCTLVLATALCIIAEANSAKAASFQGLGDLPGGDFASFANGISADGSTVVGSSHIIGEYKDDVGEVIAQETSEAFRWTQEGGIQGLGDLPSGIFFSTAGAVSADGSIVVGNSDSFGFRDKPFRWTQESGIELLKDTPSGGVSYFSSGISADGSTVVGGTLSLFGQQAFRWNEGSGVETITALEGEQAQYPPDVSADGSTIAGSIVVEQTGIEAVRLTEDGGIERLGDLPGGRLFSASTAISADASTIVGFSSGANGIEAFRWTQNQGIQGLGDLLGGSFQSRANDVSADGSIVVGGSDSTNSSKTFIWDVDNIDNDGEAFIWDIDNGIRSLQEILTNDFALDLTGWKLEEATAISDDGFTIVGNGINPNGDREAWIARIDSKPIPKTVPEPSLLLGTGIALGIGMLLNKRKNQVSLNK